MITAMQGEINIKGKNLEVGLEFLGIYSTMIETAPEIVSATILAYSEDLKDAIQETTECDIKAATELAAVYKRMEGYLK